MMKPLIVLCLTLAVSLAGCLKDRPTLDHVPALRVTASAAGTYRHEDGIFSKSGFVATTSTEYRFGDGGYTREEVRSAKGKPVVPLAYAQQVKALCPFTFSSDTVLLAGVPYVFVVH